MTTARTHQFNVGRGGAARARVAEPKPDDFTPVSAESFEVAATGTVWPDGGEEDGDVFDPSTLDFDPADHNVEDVQAYVTEHPEHADAILELEAFGKQRSGVMSFIENFNSESEN